VDSLIQELLSVGPEALTQLVETMRGDLKELSTALEREALCQSVNYSGKEFEEGIRALREKRPAKF
jgi:enoyl-CoA hydratase/carnithine racemase